MSNLVRHRDEYLYNSLSVADFGVYSSARLGKDVFSIKKTGQNISTITTGDTPTTMPSNIKKAVKIVGGEGSVTKKIYEILDLEEYPTSLSFVEPSYDMSNIELRTKPPRKGRTNEYIPTSIFLAYKTAHQDSRTVADKLLAVNEFVAQNAARKTNKHPEAFDGNGKFANIKAGIAFGLDEESYDVTVNYNDADVNITGASLAAFKTAIETAGLTYQLVDNYIVLLGPDNVEMTLSSANTTSASAAFFYIEAINARFRFECEFDTTYINETVIQVGSAPALDSTEIARIWSIHSDMAGTQSDKIAISGADYVLYRITFASDHYALDSASAMNSVNKTVDLYVKKDLIDVDYWDASDFNDEDSSTVDGSFEDLLTRAFGIAPDDWADTL